MRIGLHNRKRSTAGGDYRAWPRIVVRPVDLPKPTRTLAKRNAAEPIFILGCPRSGTSLLSRLLDNHPAVAVPFESHLYNSFYSLRHLYGDLREDRRRKRLIRDICDSPMIRRWVPRPDPICTFNAGESSDFRGVVDALLRTWTKDVGKRRWAEKTPHHAYYWPQLMRDFPAMKVLHIVRDGRDVCLSWCNAVFGPKHVYHLAHAWRRYLRTMRDLRDASAADSYHEVCYERLLADPTAELRKICAFLGESYDSAMLRYHERDVPYNTDRHNRANLARPLLTNNHGKWRTRMSARDLRVFEAIAGCELESLGYERAVADPRISSAERWRFRFVEHPARKAAAMAVNARGQADAVRIAWSRLRLRIQHVLGA